MKNRTMKQFVRIVFLLFILLFQYIEGQEIQSNNSDAPRTINCNEENSTFTTKHIKELSINCSTPYNYSELLSKLQINSINTLKLIIEPSKLNFTLSSTSFQNLNVTKLVIDYKYLNKSGKVDLLRMNSDVLYVLNVEELEIYGVMVVEEKTIKDLNNETCTDLKTLKISISDLRKVPHGWLAPCKSLVYLRLSRLRQRNGTKEVRRKVLSGAKSLRKLEILDSYIEELEDELTDLQHLEKLNVAHNQIHYALTTVVLPNLVELDLSHNHIFSSALLSSGMEKQPKLRTLTLDYNTVLDICDNLGYRTTDMKDDQLVATWHDPLSGRSLTLDSIQRLSLRGTITTVMCFGNMQMRALEYFDLSDSKIQALHIRALPQSNARRLEVNVSGCPILDVPGFTFNEQDYSQLHHEELRITGLNVSLPCDCDEHLWLAKASRERRLVLSGALCADGKDLADVPEEQLRCTKYECGVCLCRRYWQDNSTDVECDGRLHNIPKEARLRRLLASGNMVENITASDIPDSLLYLDLRHNRIARMSEDATRTLFNRPDRRVKLFGNPIICDCENRPFILGLMDHFDQVEDYTTLICIDDGRLIKNVNPDDLCFGTSRAFFTNLLASIGVTIGIVALIVGLYYRFGKTVKVYLYSKGLCLFCIGEEEIDADRPYDAFISFTHMDEDFVTNDLLPELERDPYNFNICVHYRNWIAGELIPNQINISIAKSKRTIIVLSKSYLDSIWGLLEFRTAHLMSLKEGRTRLIIVIIDDVLETGNMDGELWSYLKNNTYVKWGDPWFWNKLRYALPHKSNDAEESKRDAEESKESSKSKGDSVESESVEVGKGTHSNMEEVSRFDANKTDINEDAKIDLDKAQRAAAVKYFAQKKLEEGQDDENGKIEIDLGNT